MSDVIFNWIIFTVVGLYLLYITLKEESEEEESKENWIIFAIIGLYLLYIALKEESEENYIYSAAINIGLPIIYVQGNLKYIKQDSIGFSFKVNKSQHSYTYSLDPKYGASNVRIETKDGKVIMELFPSVDTENGDIYLSLLDMKMLKDEEVYLVCVLNGEERYEPLKRIKIKSSRLK